MASREFFPSSRSAASAKSTIMIAFFFTIADEQQNADDRDDAQIRLKISSASTAPTPADGSVERIVIG